MSHPPLNSPVDHSKMLQKRKGRKFFQQMQPTFSIDLPKDLTVELEFLDHSNPSKDLIVRKKAREWVNKNKEISKQKRGKLAWAPVESVVPKVNREETPKQSDKKKDNKSAVVCALDRPFGSNSVDPFNQLPQVGRKYDHIIQFFFTSCPEEIPCSDDKYADKSKHVVAFERENTVLGNMARGQASFILWLYATVSIRDGMAGSFDTEEVRWFYNKSLAVLQAMLQKDTAAGKFSDQLLNCLGCITATASFSGMFKTAELHRDAMVRVLALRGDGDIVKGLLSAAPWTVKAMQWCEIMVATQLVQLPKIPYLPSTPAKPAPEQVILESALRTSMSLSNLPQLSEMLHKIIHLLHHLGIAYTDPPLGKKTDAFVIQPLYDAQYALLQVLSAQKEPYHTFTGVEVLLAETFQLYFWTGPRILPPQTRLCDLLISRIMRALLPLLLEAPPNLESEPMPATTSSLHQETRSVLANIAGYARRPLLHSTKTNNAIIWSLALGTIVSKSLMRPEHSWFKEHFCLQLEAAGLDKSEERFQEFLKLFPTTDGFEWIDLRTLYKQLQDDRARTKQ